CVLASSYLTVSSFLFVTYQRPPHPILFPYTTLFRSQFKYLPIFAYAMAPFAWFSEDGAKTIWYALSCLAGLMLVYWSIHLLPERDRKSTRLNSSHEWISYAVFCLKKKRGYS